MIRRYGLAVVGVLLLAGMACAVIVFVPSTPSVIDRLALNAHNPVGEKLLAGLGLLIAWALVGFMALGERIGLIQPPKSDVISLFANERPNPVTPERASPGMQRADSPARPGTRLVR